MIKVLISIVITVLLFACNSGNVKENQTTEATEVSQENKAGYIGEKISVDNVISGEKLIAMLGKQDSVWVSMQSKIVTNCQNSGCWMDLDVGNDEVIKVTFKDYAFFVPLDSKGKTATVEGFAKKELIPVDILKHYAEDDGKSQEEVDAITEPQMAYTFEAIGVIIEE